MYLVQNGRLVSVSNEQWSAWLAGRAAGKDETLQDYGAVVWGEVGGDVSNLSPLSAALLIKAYAHAVQAVADGEEPPHGATHAEIVAHRIADLFAEEDFGRAIAMKAGKAA